MATKSTYSATVAKAAMMSHSGILGAWKGDRTRARVRVLCQ
jgi:hypothetical protein